MSSARFFRVDPRFVHATLMNAWVPYLGAKKILIADDRAVKDPRLCKILEMSTMDLVKLGFVAEEDLGKALEKEPRDVKLIVLFASLDSAKRAFDAGAAIDALNVGHLPEASDRRAVLPAVHLGPKDFETITYLRDKGVDIYLQPLPRDQRTSPFAQPQGPQPLPAKDTAPRPIRREPTPVPQVQMRAAAAAPAKIEDKVRVINERGLHLRAAHALAHLAGTLKEEVQIGFRGEFVNAKSLLGLTTLGASCGMFLDVIITGPDPKGALRQLKELFDRGFDEGVADQVTLDLAKDEL